MGFLSGWLMATVFIFIFEVILLVIGKILGGIFNFFFFEELTFSKIKGALCFSLAAGFLITII